jgi:DNA-binding CsgD family transcriptional regulator
MDRIKGLTPREREVLALLLKGKTNKDVGRLLGISPRTVEVHRTHIREKTATGSLLELVDVTSPVKMAQIALIYQSLNDLQETLADAQVKLHAVRSMVRLIDHKDRPS